MAGVRKKPLPSGKYQGYYIDSNGKQKFFVGTRNRAETRRIARHKEDEHSLVRLGYKPAPSPTDKHKKRLISEVMEEYVDWGKAQGGRSGWPWSRVHARKVEQRLKWWREELNLHLLGDLNDELFPDTEKILRGFKNAGRSGKTLNDYAGVLKTFLNWCVKRRYLKDNPLRHLQRFSTQPTNVRRAMTPEEIRKLLAVAPRHRRMLYEVALASGLRAGELRALSIHNLDLLNDGLILEPRWTKNRKQGFQPLPGDLVRKLKRFAQSGAAVKLYDRHYGRKDCKLKIPEHPLLFVPTQTARDMEKDLEAAGIPKYALGGKLDFHALRIAFVTLVFEAGASPVEAQKLARHATPQLTMNLYARARDSRLSELAKKARKAYLPKKKNAHSMHAEDTQKKGSSPNLNRDKTLKRVSNGGGGGNRTPVP